MFKILLSILGLDFSLNRNVQRSLGGRSLCGVLHCVADICSDGWHVSCSDQRAGGQFSNISNMTVFKRRTDGMLGGNNNPDREVASLSSDLPVLTRVADGVQVDGRLEAGQASLRLELVKLDDCFAHYVCQVTGFDVQGRALVSASHLTQQAGEDIKGLGDKAAWTPVMTTQILSLVHQLDTKLMQVLDSKERLEATNIGIEQGLISLRQDFTDQIHSLQNRLEDKIGLLERHIVNLENGNKIKSHVRPAPSYGDCSLAEVRNDLMLLKENIISDLNLGLFNLERNVSAAIKNGQFSLQNFTNDMEIEWLNVSDHLTSSLNAGFGAFHDRIEVRFQDLSTAINSSASETHGLLRNTDNDTADLEKAMKDMLTPKTCSKGMVPVLPSPSLPYVIIRPGKENNLSTALLCETFTDGGGWIVFQRRTTGTVDFYRDWAAYKHGFGSLDGDFWLGNEYVHSITKKSVYELRIDLRFEGKSSFAHYGTFYLAGEDDNYRIHLGPYDGTAGDSLHYHTGMMFSTYDRDNDASHVNCAEAHTGAWWFHDCHDSSLNGQWLAGNTKGPRWDGVSGAGPVSYSEMKMRRVA